MLFAQYTRWGSLLVALLVPSLSHADIVARDPQGNTTWYATSTIVEVTNNTPLDVIISGKNLGSVRWSNLGAYARIPKNSSRILRIENENPHEPGTARYLKIESAPENMVVNPPAPVYMATKWFYPMYYKLQIGLQIVPSANATGPVIYNQNIVNSTVDTPSNDVAQFLSSPNYNKYFTLNTANTMDFVASTEDRLTSTDWRGSWTANPSSK